MPEREGLGGTIPQPMPLAGHRGDCAKVTAAAVTGKDAACTCGAKP